ncbi:hypothetical protein [Paracraurococcus ruber]|uniref:Uncharacterized protein n=1 Tax=Paracraurococcus ruber TaxID=77675 RepID=A0ABS1D040_9PROT|nr:hypothetical protein [Paracraurococcus ruber]MBK1660164.1 hypothetical protein [Paracraurococcus ruber]TDG26944.1 hypothetical protein E2C05_24595 [Paracraurococcus ruber]
MAPAWLMVRAVVAEAADRPRFDRWYAAEHLPQAAAAFEARRAWRCWSTQDPSVHYAFYEFADVARAQAVFGSAAMRGQVAEFDRVWADRVTRTREVMELAGALP